jgi:hypothetical protein
MGIMLYRIFKGAVDDGADILEAYLVTSSFVHAMLKSNEPKEEGGE